VLTDCGYSTGRLAEAKILEGILAVTSRREVYGNQLIDIEMLDVLQTHRPLIAKYVAASPFIFCDLTCCRRILQISNHQDVIQVTSPRGGIINIAVADPTSLIDIRGYIYSKATNQTAFASLTAVTTFFSNSSNGMREICVKPFFHSWPRFTAVLGEVFGAKALHFRSWENGIVFGTGMFGSRGPKVFPCGKDKSHAPIYGATLSKNDNSRYLPDFCIF
jgi:hypothetical protein